MMKAHRNRFAYGMMCAAVALLVLCPGGCDRPPETGKEIRDVKAAMLEDGSLKVQFFRNGQLAAEGFVPCDRMIPANVVTETVFNRPCMGSWCVVECHANPSTSIYAAWNPQRDLLFLSDGYSLK